ncbi:MAG: TFIIB-type zinc ribbon-containing protein [Ruminococcaceae bacterium]|nr:TFIIB-type zinc ribbon-containing protein [Oscillospiraceae bacterium]
MGFVKLNCPNCGANIELSEDREYGFCSFCGTKVVQEKIVVEHRGHISVDGIANEDSLLDRAFIFIEDGDFSKAVVYLEKVLDINPRCARAYMGKLLCQLGYRRIEYLNHSQKPLECFDLYNKAIRFATPNELKEFQDYNEKTKQNYNGELNKKQVQIKNIESSISSLNQYLENNKKEFIKIHAKRILRIVLLIIGALGTLFWLVGLLVDDKSDMGFYIFMVVAFLLFLSLLIFMIIRVIKANKLIKKYNESKIELEKLNQELRQSQTSFASWKTSMLQKQ